MDLLARHSEEPFHLLVGGGDQLYCDGWVHNFYITLGSTFCRLTREPELQEWISRMKVDEKKKYPLTDEIYSAIDRFYFNHYCQSFRRCVFMRARVSQFIRDLTVVHSRGPIARCKVSCSFFTV